jgi:hypothetical protein
VLFDEDGRSIFTLLWTATLETEGIAASVHKFGYEKSVRFWVLKTQKVEWFLVLFGTLLS